jgi:xanthine dehydrogenase YagS FAD-binding subunit
MQSFEWIDATSVEQAAQLLSATDPNAVVVAKAGGMDLLDLMKEGIITPSRVINLKSITGLDGIRFSEGDGLELGALVTLARIATSSEVRSRYIALADAAQHASTPQVRNAATIGGNLLQRPRSWYFRNEHFHRTDGDVAQYVRDGENQYHAIFDNAGCAMVHASTPATALVAYDARVELTGPNARQRTVPLREFFLPPELHRENDTVIERGELLTRVIVPTPPAGTRAAYHKQTERDSYDWPICDVAVLLCMDGATVRAATIVTGWVAPTPRRAVESERLLTGKRIDETLARSAARAAVAEATPLSKNAYKVPVLETVVRRTILAAASA